MQKMEEIALLCVSPSDFNVGKQPGALVLYTLVVDREDKYYTVYVYTGRK